jgi:hypothetical protein
MWVDAQVFYAAASPQFVLDFVWPLRKGVATGCHKDANLKDTSMPALAAVNSAATEQLPQATKPKQPWQRVLCNTTGGNNNQQQQAQSTARSLFLSKAMSRKDTAAAHLRRDRLRAHAQQHSNSNTSKCYTIDVVQEEQSIRNAYCAAGWQQTQCISVQEFLFQIANTESVKCALRSTALYALIKKRQWDTLYSVFNSSNSNGLLTVNDIVQCAQQLLLNEHNVQGKFIRSAVTTAPAHGCINPAYAYSKGQAVEVLLWQVIYMSQYQWRF